MAEITVQIVLSALQTTGLLVGIFYYIMTLRNAQKSQRLAEESRQLQYLLQFSNMATLEGSKMYIELLNMEWTDYDDFERKYGSDNNPDNYAKRNTIFISFNAIGLALKRGLVDREIVFEQYSEAILTLWAKFADVIKEIRRRYNQPEILSNLEYLAEECVKYMQEKGIDTTVPDTFYRYIPDQ